MSKKNHGYRLSRRRKVFPKFHFFAFSLFLLIFGVFLAFSVSNHLLSCRASYLEFNTGSKQFSSIKGFSFLESAKSSIFCVFSAFFSFLSVFSPSNLLKLAKVFAESEKQCCVCFIFNIGSQFPKKNRWK